MAGVFGCHETAFERVSGAVFWCSLMSGAGPVDLGLRPRKTGPKNVSQTAFRYPGYRRHFGDDSLGRDWGRRLAAMASSLGYDPLGGVGRQVSQDRLAHQEPGGRRSFSFRCLTFFWLGATLCGACSSEPVMGQDLRTGACDGPGPPALGTRDGPSSRGRGAAPRAARRRHRVELRCSHRRPPSGVTPTAARPEL